MGLYAYLQISVMVEAYSNPVRQVNAVVLKELQLPGLYICMVRFTVAQQQHARTCWVAVALCTNYSDQVVVCQLGLMQ